MCSLRYNLTKSANMEQLTLEKLPQTVFQVMQTVERIEALILEQQQSPVNNEKLMRLKDAAEFLQISPNSIYQKVSARTIPFMKQGKHLYFSKAELMEYIKAGRQKTVSEIGMETIERLSKKKGGINE